jgi:hypothetical protein
VSLGCSAKVTRRFVAFIDPPLSNLPAGATADLAGAPPQALPVQRAADNEVSGLVALVQADTPAAAARSGPGRVVAAPSRRTGPQEGGASAGPAPRPTIRRPGRAASSPSIGAVTAPQRALAPRATSSRPRLQLESATPIAPRLARAASAPSQSTTGSTAMTASASASATVPASTESTEGAAAQLAQERQRIQILEEGLGRLRSDSQATQRTLVDLQRQLQAAQSERYANPLVYALAALSALLALALAGLWWRSEQQRQRPQWWTPPASDEPAKSRPAVAASAEAAGPSDPEAVGLSASPLDVWTTQAAVAPPSRVGDTQPLPNPGVSEEAARRESSVEELIDLEQQVDFFIVLGQDEAAIDLLMSHVRSDGGISPLPYLKLLEIYRRRGESDSYERIRERFNRRFNAYAPDWDADLQQGRTLVDYPETLSRLQALWATPARAMETLDASLFRRNVTDETFDLPAYREVLFLYSVARDLAEQREADASQNVDVLLPLGAPTDEDPISHLTASVRPNAFQDSEVATMPLDLDVDFAGGTDGRVEDNSIDFDLNLAVPSRRPGDPTPR